MKNVSESLKLNFHGFYIVFSPSPDLLMAGFFVLKRCSIRKVLVLYAHQI